ncbi:unnamed protein product, partial [Symbiodinium microadriaticum]
RDRFLSFADGEGEEARLPRESLRSLLECTDSFCLTKHWLAESTLDKIWKQYAAEDGIGIKEFGRLAHDGLLLEGKLEEYEKAFSGVDEGDGLISRETLGKLFAGLGKHFSAEELDQIVDEADVGHDGIDFADFLGLARTHLELAEVVRYLETTPKRVQASDEAADGMLGHITTVHSEAELDAIVASGKDVVVKLAFTWCRPCKAFLPRYEKYAKVYKDTTFLKIVGNENESCKHYAKEVLRARISPMFAVYSEGKLLTTWNGLALGYCGQSWLCVLLCPASCPGQVGPMASCVTSSCNVCLPAPVSLRSRSFGPNFEDMGYLPLVTSNEHLWLSRSHSHLRKSFTINPSATCMWAKLLTPTARTKWCFGMFCASAVKSTFCHMAECRRSVQ